MRRCATLMALTTAAVLLAAAGTALAAGPTPGVSFGGDGASWQGHPQRFVARQAGHQSTRVTELRRNGGWPARSRTIAGRFGVPMVAFDGTMEAVPLAGGALVLAAPTRAAFPRQSAFVVLSPRTLRVLRRFTLPGLFAFDALSPDGSIVYLTQHTSPDAITRYRVRAYDVRRGELLPGVIADRRTGEWQMDGVPVARLQAPGAAYAFTLYQGGEDDAAFVHALNTRDMTARCIDLPRFHAGNTADMRLRLAGGGSRLLVSNGRRTVAAIDTRALALGTPARAKPQASSDSARAKPQASSDSSGVAGLAAIAAVLVAGAGALALRGGRPRVHPPKGV